MSADLSASQIPATETMVAPVTLARLRPGAQPLTDRKGANLTYIGTVYAEDFEGTAYVKDLDKVQLANELLAAVLGLASSLPMPRPFLVAVTPDSLPITKGPLLPDGSVRLAFGSASTPFEQIGRADQLLALDAIRRWPQFASVSCFDDWIANIDRHRGNLLFQGPDKFMLIDHSHAFSGGAWSPADLIPDRQYTNCLLDGWPGRGNLPEDTRRDIAAKAPSIAASFGAIKLDDAEACAFLARVINEVRRTALVDFLRARWHHVGRIVAQRVGFPPLL